MIAKDNARFGDSPATHLSPELVPFFLSSIQTKFAVDLLLLFFSLTLKILVDREINYLARRFLCERCSQVSATPPASTTSPSVPAALPSFVVRATCRGPVSILRSASSTPWRSWTPCVCLKASAFASCEG